MKLKWMLKQLIPMSYWTKYSNGDGEQMMCLWKMWLGKPYDIIHIKI